MNTLTRIAVVAAAVAVVAVVGVYYLPGQSQFGAPGPTASPVPTASPTTQVAPEGSLEPGRYALVEGPSDPEVILTVPDGWSGGGGWVISKYGSVPPRGMAIAVWRVGNVYADGCEWRGSLIAPPIGPTVDDLATALAGLEDRDVTSPTDVVIDGHAGKRLEMTIPADIDFADCDLGEFRTWISPDGGVRYHQGPGEHSRILILDVDGERILIFGRTFPGASAEDEAELEQMLASIQIEP
jgi:hypothetical protein